MIRVELAIRNRLGLHARAAAKLVECANRHASRIEVSHGDRKVNGKSIMGVLMLAAACGVTIEITAEGEDEQAAIEALTELVNSGFGEGVEA